MLDLSLAIGHHLLIFAIFGIICAEVWAVRPGLNGAAAARIASLDLWYGILAAAILVVGFCRAIFAAKGWAYYSHNAFFWAKLGTFAIIGLLSLPPTLAFLRWRKSALQPSEAEIRTVRRYVHLELALFVLLPVFAAAMARGYGQF
jgi:putative membrane protein